MSKISKYMPETITKAAKLMASAYLETQNISDWDGIREGLRHIRSDIRELQDQIRERKVTLGLLQQAAELAFGSDPGTARKGDCQP